MKKNVGIILAGCVIGISSVLLVKLGNPANMGFCIACFIRDIAGALGLHSAAIVQYIRPEIIGLVLGSFGAALFAKEFKSKGGSSPFTRFVLGVVVMIGALVFLGCPFRMILRIAGGDLNAIVGLLGFIVGIFFGIIFLKKGFSLKRSYTLTALEGYMFPFVMVLLLALALISPAFIKISTEGPGSMAAPIAASLIVGLIAGILGQRTRLCMVGGIRDAAIFKDSYLILGFFAILVSAAVMNMAFGFFHLGFAEQPVAHIDGLWNFMGMVLVGWGSVLLGGCPFRQLILSGEGNTDSAVTIMGLLAGAAFAHNFALASSPKGPTPNGQIAVVICIVILLIISVFNSDFVKKSKE